MDIERQNFLKECESPAFNEGIIGTNVGEKIRMEMLEESGEFKVPVKMLCSQNDLKEMFHGKPIISPYV